MQTALKRAITQAGGGARLAARVGVSKAAVSQWTICPPLRVLQVEAASGVPRHLLRPDLYPPPVTAEAA